MFRHRQERNVMATTNLKQSGGGVGRVRLLRSLISIKGICFMLGNCLYLLV